MAKNAPSGRAPVLRSALFEYALKGFYLALWVYLVAQRPDWSTVGHVLLWVGAGSGLGLALGSVQQLLRGFNPARNLLGFLLIVLLESSYVVYVGTIAGLGLGLFIETEPPAENPSQLYMFAAAGLLLGASFSFIRRIRSDLIRVTLGAILGSALVVAALWGAAEATLFDASSDEANQIAFMRLLGSILLAGLPGFYLLMFCGETEEGEIEVAVLCAALGLGLYLLRLASGLNELSDKIIFLVPMLLYVLYSTRILPKLRVFKHTMRGYGFMSLGRIRDSLASFGRALQLDRRNELASRGLFDLHRKIDMTVLEPETVRLLNFDFCLQIAQQTLFAEAPPSSEQRDAAMKQLDLVESYAPNQRARVDYLKAVTQTHAKDFDLAAGYLARVLDPKHPADPAIRSGILLPAWHLAAKLHPELVRRLGEAHLALPGRRMEAIAAVERQLQKVPDDAAARDLKPLLYDTLTEAEFEAACDPSPAAPPAEFDYDALERIGLTLVDDPDPAEVARGERALRIAVHGLPQRGPWLYTRLSQVAERRGDIGSMAEYLDRVKAVGLAIGPARLAPDQRALYRAALGRLVELAEVRGDFASAADDQRLLIEDGQEDVNSLRKLAELNAKNGDVLNALLITERGLIYSKTDPDLLAKKDSLYYSLSIERAEATKDKIRPWFDVPYCLKKAKQVADQREPDLDTLDYGLHLASLARILSPESHDAMVTEARLRLRRGEREAAVQLLEDVREQKRAGSGDEEDAWFLAVRLLGDMYLSELNRPDLAVSAYSAYREYNKAGAETLYRLAEAHEACGSVPAAIKCYEAVQAYKDHPRSYDAMAAVRRLKA